MYSCFYSGSVPMKAEMKKKDFISDDEFCYQMPPVYFECTGEVYDSQSVFKWSDDSLVVVKDNCILKYTESNFQEVLVRDVEGKTYWFENRQADIYGFEDGDVEEAIERKRYTVEEYDLERLEKRKYQVVLQETSRFDHIDDSYIQELLNKAKKLNRASYLLTE